MQLKSTSISDCYTIQPNIFKDARGSFVKPFHKGTFADNGLEAVLEEEYYSVSHQGVLRGLHFQNPPYEHVKIVYCLVGKVFDAVVDLRIGSPTYGCYETFELNCESADILYVPAGLAHGFYVLSEEAIVVCNLSRVYSPEHDNGILWSSAGVPWPNPRPILSFKDSHLTPLSDFNSPFRFSEVTEP